MLVAMRSASPSAPGPADMVERCHRADLRPHLELAQDSLHLGTHRCLSHLQLLGDHSHRHAGVQESEHLCLPGRHRGESSQHRLVLVDHGQPRAHELEPLCLRGQNNALAHGCQDVGDLVETGPLRHHVDGSQVQERPPQRPSGRAGQDDPAGRNLDDQLHRALDASDPVEVADQQGDVESRPGRHRRVPLGWADLLAVRPGLQRAVEAVAGERSRDDVGHQGLVRRDGDAAPPRRVHPGTLPGSGGGNRLREQTSPDIGDAHERCVTPGPAVRAWAAGTMWTTTRKVYYGFDALRPQDRGKNYPFAA